MPFIVNPYGDPRNVSYLPNLALLKWPKPYVASYPAGSRGPNGKIRPLPGALEPVMSLGQRRLSKTLLRVFSNMMFANGMGDRFFLAGGTLVGTFLFHDMVPWDDDVDVFVDIGLRNKIQRLLGKLPRPYQWYPQKQRDKLYTSVLPEKYNKMDVELSRRPFKYPWAWPFLDICYFKSNGTHFWESNIGANNPIYIPLSVIFPTYFRPLGNDWYPAPRDTDLYLRLWYRRKVGCLNGGYSHALEKSHEAKEIPCQMLLHQYAQVERIRLRYESATVGKSASEISFGIIQERLIMDSDFGLVTLHTLCLPVINELKIA
ncbi:Lipopolysaccharide choline [Fasciola gigantica]|uniref:Lipopolysaccharide choline n=1 Tax=Fasciola gigantica TaxID=46835 RepID=A0A504YU45_FASGI|nr:Lipopolysaccharide choline [Fasciola gigantica]